jgi:hypothetical protein
MDKKVSKINQGKIQPGIWQYGFLGLQEGDCVIIHVDEKDKGRFGYFYKPENKTDLDLVKEYENKGN